MQSISSLLHYDREQNKSIIHLKFDNTLQKLSVLVLYKIAKIKRWKMNEYSIIVYWIYENHINKENRCSTGNNFSRFTSLEKIRMENKRNERGSFPLILLQHVLPWNHIFVSSQIDFPLICRVIWIIWFPSELNNLKRKRFLSRHV